MRHHHSLLWRCALAVMMPMAFALSVSPGGAQQSPPSSPEFEAFKQKMLGEFEDFRQEKLDKFEAFKKEFEEYKKIVTQERDQYTGKVSERWDEPELSSPKVWVEYSDDLRERNRVDFENETITIETVQEEGLGIAEESEAYRKAVRARIEEIVTKNAAEAFADDVVAQAIEMRSKDKIDLLETAQVPPEPILIPYLTGVDARAAEQADETEAYAADIVEGMMENLKTTRATNRRGETVIKAEVPLAAPRAVIEAAETQQAETRKGRMTPPGKLPRRAAALWEHVDEYAKVAGISNSLVFAVIETESAFDPMATSWIPAYGLMQIVPGSAGMDVTEKLFGEARILAPSYLYIAKNNIRVGTTYLNILSSRYLRSITNPESRLYCSVAAYNTGAGNVFKAFTGKMRTDPAVAKINAMTPQQVYDTLRVDLPRGETRKYLEKVIRLIGKYDGYGV